MYAMWSVCIILFLNSGQGLGYYSNLAILYYVGSRIIHSYRNKEEPAISERITNLDDKVDRFVKFVNQFS